MESEKLQHSPLGKQSNYVSKYDAKQLCAIPRELSWKKYGYQSPPYFGFDIWNAYEISWLNENGMPQVAIGEFIIPLSSPNLIESKSFKLYLNSFNQSSVKNSEELIHTLQSDLSSCAGETIKVDLFSVDDDNHRLHTATGKCLDHQNITTDVYKRDISFLQLEKGYQENEVLYSHLLKTNCPVTGQPDWGSLFIEYSGKTIVQSNLLKYIVSYRDECDFHEQCVENIFLDIMKQCQPDELTVYARYLRRGGLDINPYRSTKADTPGNNRLIRQ
jgi:7-cyano-7-deazaguanine reductase